MKLPKLDDLIDEQKNIYFHSENENIFVVGPPGSGKTTLAIFRAKYLIELKLNILIITRNRMLAALAKELGGDKVTSKTMHEFIASDHSKKIGSWAPNPIRYQFQWDTIINSYANADIKPEIDHLIIDEGQNLPSGFFRWATIFAAKTVTVFADENQTIDPLRATIAEICAANLPSPIRLHQNHRNTVEVARVAEHFYHALSKLPPGVVQKSRGGETPYLAHFNSLNDFSKQVISRYKNRGESIGIIVYEVNEVENLFNHFKQALPAERVDSYTNESANADAGKNLLNPGITILSGESAIGLEFDAVFLLDLSRSLPTHNLDDYRRLYMLCSRAKTALILATISNPLNDSQIASLPDERILNR